MIMKKISVKTIALSVVLCLLPMIVGAIFYSRLPDQMAMHWGMGNQPNAYANKVLVLFGLPGFCAVLQAVLGLAFYFPGKSGTVLSAKVATIFIWIIPIITAIVYTITLLWGLGQETPVGKIVCLVYAAVNLLVGNYFPKISYEQNKDRMHPKPKDEAHFRKMLKAFAIPMMIVGVGFLVLAFFV
jgi:uncharacterized membrane protein